jgi:predicted  nucleic acid-binding Zn-ribbon protein
LKSLEEELAPESSGNGGLTETERLNELVAAYQTLEAQKKSLADSVLALEGRKEEYLRAFRDTVGDVRSKSVGIQWTDVPFRNGQILKEVRIQKVTDTEITLAHSEGVAKLRVDELPPDLKDRFRIGMEPFLSSPEPTVGAATPLSTSASTTKESTSSKASKPSATATLSADALNASVASLEQEVVDATSKLRTAEAAWSQWRTRAASLRDQAGGAKVSGRPSYNLLQEANTADQKAAALGLQVANQRDLITQLRQKANAAKLQAAKASRAKP